MEQKPNPVLRAAHDEQPTVVTTITLSPRLWRLLGGLARERAELRGGRPSQSAVVRELVEAEAQRREREKADAS